MNRRVLAWILYDWAYAAFNTIVTTFVFATYFVRAVAPDAATGTIAWASTQSIAGIAIALGAVPLGAVADLAGQRRRLLRFGSLIMIAAMASLWFIRPQGPMLPALLLVGMATTAFELSLIFYNAMLAEIAAPARIGRLSGIAWGAGYIGGLIALGLCLVVLILPRPPPFGLDPASSEPVRAASLFAAAWMAIFAAPLLLQRDPHPNAPPPLAWHAAIAEGVRGLRQSFRAASGERAVWRFLLARMLYNDGLTTLFAFGAIYAAGSFGMSTQQILYLGILMNVFAGIGALGFAMVEDRLGAKTVILASLGALLVLSSAILVVRDARLFWLLAPPLGLFVGPAQSASRSLMAHLAPPAERNRLFGLFALSGRVTGFLGPAALAIVTALTGSQRAGMTVILALFVAGGALLVPLQTAIPARAARRIT